MFDYGIDLLMFIDMCMQFVSSYTVTDMYGEHTEVIDIRCVKLLLLILLLILILILLLILLLLLLLMMLAHMEGKKLQAAWS